MMHLRSFCILFSLFSLFLSQPYYSSDGNYKSSASVWEETQYTNKRNNGIKLQWKIDDIKETLKGHRDDWQMFDGEYSTPLIPNLQTKSSLILVQASKLNNKCQIFSWEFSNCTECYIVALDGESGEYVWSSSRNVSWDFTPSYCVPFDDASRKWWASEDAVYVNKPQDFGFGPSSIWRYSIVNGDLMYKILIPITIHDKDPFALNILETKDQLSFIVITDYSVFSFNIFNGALLWNLTLPFNLSYPVGTSIFDVLYEDTLVLSYLVYSDDINFSHTIGIDVHSGKIIWINPYSVFFNISDDSNIKKEKLESKVNGLFVEPCVGGHLLYFMIGTLFSIAAIDLRSGKLAWKTNVGISIVDSNFAAGDGILVAKIGDGVTYNPTFVFDENGKFFSFWINKTEMNEGNICSHLFLEKTKLGPPVLYAFCLPPDQPYSSIYELIGIDLENPKSILWSTSLGEIGDFGKKYLGNGRFLIGDLIMYY